MLVYMLTYGVALAPPSDNVTLDTEVPVGLLSSSRLVKELVSTIDGPFCYVYE